MEYSNDSDFATGDAVNEVVRIAGEYQFAGCARFRYSPHQGEAGKKFSLAEDVIYYVLGCNGVIGRNVSVYRQQVALGASRPFKLLFCSLRHVAPVV